jgi:hypothetical protein
LEANGFFAIKSSTFALASPDTLSGRNLLDTNQDHYAMHKPYLCQTFSIS